MPSRACSVAEMANRLILRSTEFVVAGTRENQRSYRGAFSSGGCDRRSVENAFGYDGCNLALIERRHTSQHAQRPLELAVHTGVNDSLHLPNPRLPGHSTGVALVT